MTTSDPACTIGEILAAYRAGRTTPERRIGALLERMAGDDPLAIWICRLTPNQVKPYVDALAGRSPADLPLYGVPFAIKDNIDLAGVPTTQACPAAAYVPERSAAVVQRLLDAGAVPVGKTNMDQLATGLVGTRSPYGACANAFDARYVSGGSSSGSAVAVALGLVPFSLGTDTAGSGRVPAGFNNLVGLKPSPGRLSTRGVAPACRSLDCVSVFAGTAVDAERVFRVTAGFDPLDPFSRELPLARSRPASGVALRFGVPQPQQLEFCGDAEYARCYGEALERLESLGGQRVSIDLEPFLAAARLLYEGPWLAERRVANQALLDSHADALFPVTREILQGGARWSAEQTFRAQYRLRELQREAARIFTGIDVLVLPTTPTIYTIEAVQADPIALNTNLGRYTNFVNLLDLAGVAVPSGFRRDGLPFGITLLAPSGADPLLLAWADRFQRASATGLGALGRPLPEEPALSWSAGTEEERIAVAVCGAHMEGLPLNAQLRERDALLLRRTRTAPWYRLYALPDGKRPGLVRVSGAGAAIEVEVWSVPAAAFGSFVAGIPAPLGIGKLELADGSWVSGFVCESHATSGALDITRLGGWRRHLELRDQARRSAPDPAG